MGKLSLRRPSLPRRLASSIPDSLFVGPVKPSLPGGTRCPEALVAGRPTKPFGTHKCSKESGPRSAAKQDRSSCVAPLRSSCGGPCGHLTGATSWKRVPPRSAKNVLQILYLMAKFNVAKSGLDFQACAGRPSLPEGPRCREALVAGGPSLGGPVAGRPSLPGGPRCRKALVAGRPSLPGGPRCRRASLPGGPRCREALVALRSSLPGGGRPSLLGGPRCREVLVAGRRSLPGGPRCREALVGRPCCREALVARRPSLSGRTAFPVNGVLVKGLA